MKALLLAFAVLPRPQSVEPADMRSVIELHRADHELLERRYAAPMSAERTERLRRFDEERLAEAEALDYDALDVDGRVDWHLLRNAIRSDLADLELEARRDGELAELLPFAPTITALAEARQRVERVDADASARTVAQLHEDVEAALERLGEGEFDDTPPVVASRAVRRLDDLADAFDEWFRFRVDYDPIFTWWVGRPHEAARASLDSYRDAIRSRLVESNGERDATLTADPIGRDALLAALAREYVPYSPEELVAIAEREFAWCDEQMLAASRELGFGDDWRAAQDHVKSLYVAPGEQPYLVRDLVEEAIDWFEARDLVTIPPLCAENWRMTMLSADQQRTSPYFLGGECIQVSYPTSSMDDDAKRATLLGNNVHFARAVAHHEVIPGHGLQAYVQARNRPYRRMFSTPFWVEGWALYWEMRLFDLDFARGPEDRIGMLFWRKHRCARIVFSLSVHLGTMTPEEAVDYLVERVGHERKNAEGEVRRSVGGLYPPLYQAAYMLGGLQLRALHDELVARGEWTERRFHDAVLHENSIPIELLRAALRRDELPRDFESSWRFADE
ncbi:MAG: DUF885 family protein [Planctomycetota bacterium]